MPFEHSIGAILFRREKNKKHYLILKRKPVIKKTGNFSGTPDYWDLPKGHPEKGETKIEAIKREIQEETGISRVKYIPGFSTWTTFFYRAKGEEKNNRRKKKIGLNVFKVVDYFIFETKTKKAVLSREHEDYAWLEYKEAIRRITYQKTRNVLVKANKFIINTD
ncbi:MAG: NUDIX domain-containing protein [Parcubacteria group bacterium]|jgi:8-oxo-dGTP pyrophosphatase MutT (NUDIX family)